MDYDLTEKEKEKIIEEMKPYIKEAKTKKLIFYNKSIREFLTPEELEECMKKGQWIMPFGCWLMYHAINRYKELKEDALDAIKKADDFFEKMFNAGYL
jgi:hypothetical protein